MTKKRCTCKSGYWLHWSKPAEKCDNILITFWPDMSLTVFPKLLFYWSELTCTYIPTKLPKANKERQKNTSIISMIDCIPGHHSSFSLYASLQTNYTFCILYIFGLLFVRTRFWFFNSHLHKPTSENGKTNSSVFYLN